MTCQVCYNGLATTAKERSMTVVYEWDVETVADGETEQHEDGECIDHCHFEKFGQAVAFADTDPPAGCRYAVVLVRDDDGGRSWAYLEGGKLPEYFTDADGADAAKVPQRFVREVAA